MTKPANFPERRRQRQIGALRRTKAVTAANVSNAEIIETLRERTAQPQHGNRTKKDHHHMAKLSRNA